MQYSKRSVTLPLLNHRPSLFFLSEELDEILILCLNFSATIPWADSLTFGEAGASDNSVAIDFSYVEDFAAVDSAKDSGYVK